MIVESILIHLLGLFNQFARGIGKVQYGTAEYSKQILAIKLSLVMFIMLMILCEQYEFR